MASAGRSERFLVTGILGCIGAWTARLLAEEGVEVVGFDLGTAIHRLELVLTPEQREQVTIVRGDITDLAAFERALDAHEITNVIHLAALQVPFCKADPVLGAQVNVVGTVNVFEAVRRANGHVRGLVYASSAAVFGDGPGPETLYGVYKVCNEESARFYATDYATP